MKLTKRLQAICDLIDEGSRVIDVGADHALVDIYLTKYKNCKCIATDISENCIQKAKENIEKNNLNIQTIVTDGLNNINLKDEKIIIAGMGAHTILKILNKNITNDLIISAHTDIPLLRKEIQKKGYYIENEKVIHEKHYYVITYYKYGKKKKINNYITPFIKDKKYINYLKEKYQIKYKYEKNIFKKLKYLNILNKIKRKTK
ncbi:MAG: SAM-dependent methyltransferase [Bacilli bacterium]|nr:SAM-dependent methyltransferase [Bacilli bacterium]